MRLLEWCLMMIQVCDIAEMLSHQGNKSPKYL